MSDRQDNRSGNPYEPPQTSPEVKAKSTPTETHWAWSLIISGTLALAGLLMVQYWLREFGMPGVIMLFGGCLGAYLGVRLSKRWWGLAIGAVIGFTGGAALGVGLHLVF